MISRSSLGARKKDNDQHGCRHLAEKSEAEAQREEPCSPDETTLAMTFIQKKYLLLERSLWLPQEGILAISPKPTQMMLDSGGQYLPEEKKSCLEHMNLAYTPKKL